MFKIAFKVAKENKYRFIFTIFGYVAASFILVMGLYYTHVTEAVVKDNFNQELSENRVILNQVTIPCVTYYDVDGFMIPEVNPIGSNIILSLLSMEGIDSLKVEYELFDSLIINIDGKRIYSDRPYAIDANYDSISAAMVDSIKKTNGEFVDIIAGKNIEHNEPMTMLIGEACVAYMGYSNDEVIGKTVSVNDSNGNTYELTIVGVYSNEVSMYYLLNPEDVKGMYCQSDIPDDFIADFIFNYKFFELIKGEKITPSSIYITVEDVKYIDNVTNIIEKQYDMTYLSHYKSYYEQISQQEKMAKVFTIVGCIVLILVLLMIINTLMINLSQQKRLISLLRLLGYTKRKVRLFFVYQSIVFSGIGIVIGTALGLLISTYQGLSITNGLSEYNVSSSDFLLPFGKVGILSGVILSISIIASYVIIFCKTAERKKYAK